MKKWCKGPPLNEEGTGKYNMLNVGRYASNGIRVLVWRTNGGSGGRKVMLCPARTSLRKFSLRQVCFYNFHGLGEIEKKGEK